MTECIEYYVSLALILVLAFAAGITYWFILWPIPHNLVLIHAFAVVTGALYVANQGIGERDD